MARRKNTGKSEDTLIDIVEVRDQTSDFFQQNKKWIVGLGGGLLAILALYFGYKYLYAEPKEKEAASQMVQAQTQFEKDSFALALTNPGGGFPGFDKVAKDYKWTKTGNVALYYAGISCLQLGKYEAAIDYLKDFNDKGTVLGITKMGAIGDAYAELKKMDDAKSYYKKAINAAENELLTPYYQKKLAMLLESQGDKDGALNLYQEIKDKYPTSPEGTSIDKYLERLAK